MSLEISSQGLVKKWAHNGHKDAVAVYGCSVESLITSLQLGFIPGVTKETADMSYKKRLITNGNNLYFTLPNISEVENTNPRVFEYFFSINRVNRRLPSGKKVSFRDYWMSISDWEAQIRRASIYARGMAIRHAFYEMAGINRTADQVAALAKLLFPKSLDKLIARDLQVAEAFENDFDGTELTVGAGRLKSALETSLKRKGVLIYYSPKVFGEVKRVRQGKEDLFEMLFLSEKPLTLKTISGVEFLSREDRKVLTAAIF